MDRATLREGGLMAGEPRLLDGFCKAGGAGEGYYRVGFDVTGVDVEPQPHYPRRFIQADFFEYVEAHGHEYDAIHASPPCQIFTGFARMNALRGITKEYVNLIPDVRKALLSIGVPYVIENIEAARAHLFSPVKLCGSSFGLEVRRHRLFESNMLLSGLLCDHAGQGRPLGVYGRPGSAPMRPTEFGGGFVRARNADEAGRAMGIGWMDWRELTQAIPPAPVRGLGRLRLGLHPSEAGGNREGGFR